DGRRAFNAGHPQVHEDDVRPQGRRQRQRGFAIARLTDHLELGGPGKHPAQAVPNHRMIVHDEQADGHHAAASSLARGGPDMPGVPDEGASGSGPGTSSCATMAGTRAEIAVPPPGSDSMTSVPATRFTRCRMAVRPKPVPFPPAPGAISKPTPS